MDAQQLLARAFRQSHQHRQRACHAGFATVHLQRLNNRNLCTCCSEERNYMYRNRRWCCCQFVNLFNRNCRILLKRPDVEGENTPPL